MSSPPLFFSKQLAGWVGQLLLLIVIVMILTAFAATYPPFGPWFIVFTPLLIGYYLLATWGWRRALRSRSAIMIHRYFAVQLVYIGLLMAIELTRGVTGLSTSILGFNLMIQAAVLELRARLVLFGGLLLLILLFYVPSTFSTQPDLAQTVANLLLFALVYGLSALLGLLVVREERARETARRLDETNRKLAQYAEEIETLSILNERNRLAREIHDNLGHYLTAINIQLELAQMTLSPADEQTLATVSKAQTLTREALTEIRRSISALRASPMDHRTLHEAIGLLVAEHQATGNRVEYSLIGTVRPGVAAVDMALYRITQEALTNIRKHAQAASAQITLSYADAQTITLHIEDDGIGSDDPTAGFGLLGIQERLHLLGGTLTIDTARGRGFSLRVVIAG